MRADRQRTGPTWPTAMRALGASVLVALLVGSAHADRGVDTTTTDHPLIMPVLTSAPPVIDGVLDDAVWSVATQLDDFYVPSLDRPPTERTVLWLACDDTYIYWAGRMYDSQPDQMRMDQTRRGGYVRNDDYISVGFDVDNHHIGGGEHVFRMTPRGTQAEDFPDGAAGKVEWRGDWQGAAHIDSLGWTVEVAIPMRIFDRPPGPRVIGVSAARWHPRTQERILWPNMGAEWDRAKLADWVGVVLPRPHERPRFMPYVVAESVKRDGTWHSEVNAGLDAKWTAPNGVRVVATAYPDFRNVEREILGLDFSYGQIELSETRPFFKEGSGYMPKTWLFYSNNIGDVYGGVKAFGEIGTQHRLGIVEAYGRDRVNHVAGEWYWQPANRLEIESWFTLRDGPTPDVDSTVAPSAERNGMFVTQIVKSRMSGSSTDKFRLQGGGAHTSDGVGAGWDLEASWDRDPGNACFGWYLRGRLLSPEFITMDGSLQANEADQREVSAGFGYEREHDRRLFRAWDIWVGGKSSWRFDDALYQAVYNLDGSLEIWPGAIVWLSLSDRDRPPYHDRTVESGFGWRQDRLFSAGEIGVEAGKVKDTDFLRVWLEQGFHPLRALTASLGVQYRRRDFPVGHVDDPAGDVEVRHQVIGTVQYDLTTERAVSGRIVRTEDGINGYATFQQVVRRGVDLFLIVGDPNAETWTRRVALKAVVVL